MDDAALATQGVAELGELLHQALGELGAGDAISAELTLLGAIETLDELEAAVEPAEEWPALDGLLPLDLDGLRPLELDGPPPLPLFLLSPSTWSRRRRRRRRRRQPHGSSGAPNAGGRSAVG